MSRPVRLRLAERIARWLLRRYPGEFRARFGADIEADLARAIRERRFSGVRLVVDGVSTFIRSWSDQWRRDGTMTTRIRVDWSTGVAYTFRSLRRDPVHGMVSVMTLALAIGANAAVFSVAHSVLLRTLPYAAPERTVEVHPAPVRITASGAYAVLPALTALPQVEGGATFTSGGSGSLSLESGAEPVHVTHVDGRFFDVLGARMHIGRGVSTDGTGNAEVVLSHGLWMRAFGGAASVIGRTIRLTDHALTVVGVTAAEVDYPAGTDLWLSYPLLFDLMGAASGGDVIARVARAEDIDLIRDAHETRMRAHWEEAGETFPEDARPVFTPLREALVGPAEASLWLLLGASGLVFVLGCVNLAGLSVARVSARRGEFTVRRALGAGRASLVRMMLTESLVISSLAGVAALALVVWGRSTLARMLPAELPGLAVAGPGLETIAFVFALAVMAGLAIGVIPSVQAGFPGGDGTAGAAGRILERRPLHPALVVVQIGLAVVLVVSAGLLGRSVLRLRAVPLGFETDRIVTFEARLPWAAAWDTTAFRSFAHDIRLRLIAQPGVREVGIASRLPLSDGLGVAYRVWPDGRDETETNRSASIVHASGSYFGTMGISFIAGGTFADDAGADRAVIISRSVAEQLFGRSNVVGETVRVRASVRAVPPSYTIVGVVDDVRANGFTSDPVRTLYLPFDRQPVPSMAFAVRADRELGDVVPLIRDVVREVDSSVAPFAVRSMRSAANEAIAARDALALVSSLFGTTAMLLATLGIYGLVAQSVVRRRREMGLRLAVGARSVDLLTLVLRNALAIAVIGITLGLLVALGVTRLLGSFLWGVQSADPLTYGAVALGALAAVVVASLPPARRAARLDPLESLRTG
jgi:predicted permease